MAVIISILLLFLGIGVLVLIHICVVGRALRRELANNNNNNIVERSSIGSTSMSRDDLEKLPCFDFEAKEKGSSPVDCAVCLENFKGGEKCRLLPLCRHSFHAECVDLWLMKTPLCPICRASADLVSVGMMSGEESSRYNESVTIELSDLQAAGNDAAAAAAVIELRENQEGAEGDHMTGAATDDG